MGLFITGILHITHKKLILYLNNILILCGIYADNCLEISSNTGVMPVLLDKMLLFFN